MKVPSLIQRTITGLLLVALMIWAILDGPYTFVIFFAILTFGILWEYFTLINVSRECHILRPVHSFGGMVLFICAFLAAAHITPTSIWRRRAKFIMPSRMESSRESMRPAP